MEEQQEAMKPIVDSGKSGGTKIVSGRYEILLLLILEMTRPNNACLIISNCNKVFISPMAQDLPLIKASRSHSHTTLGRTALDK
jgi:hypothetical protein